MRISTSVSETMVLSLKRVEFPLHGSYSMSRKLKDLRAWATCPLVHVVPREQSKSITVWASDSDTYWTSSKHPEGGPWADPRHLSLIWLGNMLVSHRISWGWSLERGSTGLFYLRPLPHNPDVNKRQKMDGCSIALLTVAWVTSNILFE